MINQIPLIQGRSVSSYGPTAAAGLSAADSAADSSADEASFIYRRGFSWEWLLKEILMIKNLKSHFKVKAKGKSSFKQKPKDLKWKRMKTHQDKQEKECRELKNRGRTKTVGLKRIRAAKEVKLKVKKAIK